MLRSSPRSAPQLTAEELLELPRLPGRWRARRHALMLIPALVAGWAWFGIAGALPLVIWWWYRRPVPERAPWRLDLGRARAARLGPRRTCIRFRGAPPVEIFHDEIAPADLARLRRNLKVQLAAG